MEILEKEEAQKQETLKGLRSELNRNSFRFFGLLIGYIICAVYFDEYDDFLTISRYIACAGIMYFGFKAMRQSDQLEVIRYGRPRQSYSDKCGQSDYKALSVKEDIYTFMQALYPWFLFALMFHVMGVLPNIELEPLWLIGIAGVFWLFFRDVKSDTSTKYLFGSFEFDYYCQIAFAFFMVFALLLLFIPLLDIVTGTMSDRPAPLRVLIMMVAITVMLLITACPAPHLVRIGLMLLFSLFIVLFIRADNVKPHMEECMNIHAMELAKEPYATDSSVNILGYSDVEVSNGPAGADYDLLDFTVNLLIQSNTLDIGAYSDIPVRGLKCWHGR